MRIAIAATTFDLSGRVLIKVLANSTDGITRRRINRVPTLDGRVAVNDRGYAEGDRDLVYSWRTASKAHSDLVDRMVRLYAQVRVCTPDGVYLAAMESFEPGHDESTLTMRVVDKLA